MSMEVPRGYEQYKAKKLKEMQKNRELREKFEKATEWKTRSYII